MVHLPPDWSETLREWLTFGLVVRLSYQVGMYTQRMESCEEVNDDHEERLRNLETLSQK